jgi:hypothetical protein
MSFSELLAFKKIIISFNIKQYPFNILITLTDILLHLHIEKHIQIQTSSQPYKKHFDIVSMIVIMKLLSSFLWNATYIAASVNQVML